jgi:hypothetical protein
MTRWKLPITASVFLALAYLFGDLFGLAFATLLVLVSILGRIEPGRLWAAAALLIALAPAALLAQGLPSGPVVGPAFGTRHMLAHALVGMSLATAAWAGLLELTAGAPARPRLRATRDPAR